VLAWFREYAMKLNSIYLTGGLSNRVLAGCSGGTRRAAIQFGATMAPEWGWIYVTTETGNHSVHVIVYISSGDARLLEPRHKRCRSNRQP
jgi:hypothetical protein